MTEEQNIDRLYAAYTQLQENPGQDAINQLKELAQGGSLMSMLYLAWAHKDGIGVTANDNEAEAWYRRAVCGDSQLATYYLGHFYLDKTKYTKAEEAFSIGASLGYSPAMFCLGCMYLEGTGVAKDLDKPIYFSKKRQIVVMSLQNALWQACT